MTYEPVRESDLQGEGRLPQATWGWRELGLALLAVLAAYLLVSFALVSPADAAWSQDSDNFRFVTGLSAVIVDLMVAAAVVYLVLRSGGTLATLGFRPPVAPDKPRTLSQMLAAREGAIPWGYVAKLVFGALVASIVSTQVYAVVLDRVGLDGLLPEPQFDEAYFENTRVVAMLGLGVVVAAPVIEELFFRGFLFAGLVRYWGFVPAALATGLLFSVAHAQDGLIIPFTLIGALFAYLYYRSGSLIPSILTHCLFNSLSFAVLLLVPEARS